MANIPLPGKNLIQGDTGGGEGSAAAAAAPWAAAEHLGQTIQHQGDKVVDVMVKLQRVKNVKLANDMQLAAEDEFAAFQRDMATNPNPEQWGGMWSKRLDKIKAAHMPANLAPEQQALIGERYAGFASRTINSIAERSITEGIGQAKQSVSNRIQQSIRSGDRQGGKQAIADGQAAGLYSAEDADKLRMEHAQQQEASEVEQLAQADPLGTKEALEEKNSDGTWKNYPNLDPNQRLRMADMAKSQSRAAMGDAVEDAQNGMSDGSITKPEQLTQRYSGIVSPRVMEKLQAELAGRWDSAKQLERAQPAYQNNVVGKVSAMLADFNAESEDYDEKYVEMDSLVRTLPPGAAKDELSRQLSDARSGQRNERKTIADMGRTTLAEAYKGGLFGDVTAKQSLRSVIDDGLLTDTGKLQRLGFDEKQAKKIATAKNETERMDIYREEFRKRRGIDKTTPFEREAFLAIRDGKAASSMVTWTDADKQKRALQAYGKAVTEVEEWIKTHPEATSGDLADKIYSIATPHGVGNASRIILTAPPVLDEDDGTEDLPPLPATSSTKDRRIDDPLQIADGAGGSSDALLPPLSVR